uniref:Uncharacterized protein n=1 Tax=Oryza punctata TaxID=4537 RepID=A0A0E0MHX4_ORYPU
MVETRRSSAAAASKRSSPSPSSSSAPPPKRPKPRRGCAQHGGGTRAWAPCAGRVTRRHRGGRNAAAAASWINRWLAPGTRIHHRPVSGRGGEGMRWLNSSLSRRGGGSTMRRGGVGRDEEVRRWLGSSFS